MVGVFHSSPWPPDDGEPAAAALALLFWAATLAGWLIWSAICIAIGALIF